MRKTLLPMAFAILSVVASAQQRFTTHIEPLRNEKWWGYFTGGGPSQPFSEAFAAEITDTGSFTVPLMVSDQGRYIWSEYPFEVSSDGRAFTVISKDAPVNAEKGGKTLREAYLYCVHKNIWPHSDGPANHLFQLPLYDAGMISPAAPKSATLLAMADSLRRAGFFYGTILIPDGWQENSPEGGFDKALFPSFHETAHTLLQSGFAVMLTVTPYIPAAGRSYVEALRAGIIVLDEDGSPAVIHNGSGYYVCLDMTLQSVVKALEGRLGKLSVSPESVMLYFDCHEVLGLLNEEQRENYVKNWVTLGERFNAVMYPLGNNAPCRWHPYSVSPSGGISWNSLRESLVNILNAGLTGHIYPYLSLTQADTPHTDEELLLRAFQLAMYMPISALPPCKEAFQEERYQQALRSSMEQRRAMNEYMEKLLLETRSTGEPPLRHMEYQFPAQGFANCNDQFMLGSKYLIAPVLESAGKRTVRLPRGLWIAEDGTRYRGPRVINVDVSNGQMPVFRLR